MTGERFKNATYNTNRDGHFHVSDGDIIFNDNYSVMASRKLTKSQREAKEV